MISRVAAEQTLEKYQDELIELPNVVGLSVAAESNDAGVADYVAVVFVKRKVGIDVLQPSERIPSVLKLDDATQVPVRVVEVGDLRPQNRGQN